MKKNLSRLGGGLLFTFFLSSLVLTAGCFVTKKRMLIPSKHYVTKEQAGLNNFTAIHADGDIKLILTQGEQYQVTLRCPDNIEQYIDISQHRDILDVSFNHDLRVVTDCDVEVSITLPHLRELTLSRDCEVEGRTPFTTDQFITRLSSSAEVSHLDITAQTVQLSLDSSSEFEGALRGEVATIDGSSGASVELNRCDLKKLSVELSSASEASLHGSIDECKLLASSGSEFDGEHLAVRVAEIELSSGSEAELQVIDSLSYSLSSGSSLQVYGNPTILRQDTDVSSSFTLMGAGARRS